MQAQYDPHSVIASVERDRENGLDDTAIPTLYRAYDAHVNAPTDELLAHVDASREALFEYAMEVIVGAANLLERQIDEGRSRGLSEDALNDMRTTEEARLADLRQRALTPEA